MEVLNLILRDGEGAGKSSAGGALVPAQVERDHLVQLRVKQNLSLGMATLARSGICFSGEQSVWI